jgi:hypothetical protein
MATVTIDVPDELAEQLDQMRDRLPELLALSLQQPALPARLYHDILTFLASNPAPEAIAAYAPSQELLARLRTLLGRNATGQLTIAERAELDAFERIEHLMVMIKTNNLAFLAAQP